MKKHFDDLTQINCPLGDLDDDTAARLFVAWRNSGEVQFCNNIKYGFTVTRNPGWWPTTTYRVKPEPLKDIDPPWDYLPDWVHFVARDKDRMTWAFEVKPNDECFSWHVMEGNYRGILIHDDRKGNKPWRESLVERPNK